MPRANLEIIVLVCSVQTEARQACKRWRITPADDEALADAFDVQTVRVQCLDVEQDQVAQLETIRDTPPAECETGRVPRVTLLLSDAIAAGLGIPPDGLAEVDKAALDCFREQVIALVALGDVREQIHDVAATLPLNATPDEAVKLLREIVLGLKYLAPPVGAQLPPGDVTIRRLRTQTELLKAFSLRYQVYSKLNYVSRRVRLSQARLDVDSFDGCAVHFGAFHREWGKPEQLVGTARVILMPAIENNLFSTWTRRIAGTDPDLLVEVCQPANQLGLPVFTSQPMNDEMADNIQNEYCVAELSRVIVADAFRGGGISLRIIQEAVSAAESLLVRRMYLECLPLHVRLYEKFQFSRLGSFATPVFQVNRTMIAMRREMPELSASWRASMLGSAKESRHAPT